MSLVLDLLERRGRDRYGQEPVTQLAHALQCAELAVRAKASDALVVAALLHDVGHLIGGFDDSRMPDVDYGHEHAGADFLATLYSPEVSEPVRLHVDAKRWLCATQPDYYEGLSAASKHSLRLQGGVFTPDEAAAFEALPFARDAIRLRVWDDAAKVPGFPTRPLTDWASLLASTQRRVSAPE